MRAHAVRFKRPFGEVHLVAFLATYRKSVGVQSGVHAQAKLGFERLLAHRALNSDEIRVGVHDEDVLLHVFFTTKLLTAERARNRGFPVPNHVLGEVLLRAEVLQANVAR